MTTPPDSKSISSGTRLDLESDASVFYEEGGIRVHHGDCLQLMRAMPDCSVDAVVTDPPYAIGAVADADAEPESCPAHRDLGAGPELDCPRCRDYANASAETVLMAGAMLGQHSTNYNDKATHSRGYADNDNTRFQGWCALWLAECFRLLKPGGHLVAFGGTRSAHRLFSAAEDSGFEIRDQLLWLYGTGAPKSLNAGAAARAATGSFPEVPESEPGRWDGWWTGIKPAHEPILLARKPPQGRVVDNLATFGVGALNVDACRVGSEPSEGSDSPDDAAVGGAPRRLGDTSDEASRWPSNLLLDSEAASFLDGAAGAAVSRYFWVAKPASTERVQVGGTTHPTVKPLALMRRLSRLVTPAGGLVLDPFAGSGTTAEACLLEGMRAVVMEREAEYLPLIRQRIDRRRDPVRAVISGRAPKSEWDLFDLFE